MTISDAQFSAWLKSQDVKRCVLVEINVGLAGGGNVTRYLSTRPYVTGTADTPANTVYTARINGGIKFSRKINLDGGISLSFGDIELTNMDGGLDSWLYDYWSNRAFTIYLGDVAWARADFRPVFYGVTTGIDTRSRSVVNVKISDKTQRLNTPMTINKLGGATALDDTLVPLLFGEAHNVTPLLTNHATNEYQLHDGTYSAFENIIEVRDNGVPVAFTATAGTGKFTLTATPYGTVTASAQGAVIPANLLVAADNAASLAFGGVTSVFQPSGVAVPYVGASVNAVTASAINSTHAVTKTFTGIAATMHTASMLVKKGLVSASSKSIQLQMFVTADGNALASVTLDLTTGALTPVVGSTLVGQGGSIISTGAVDIGNGWFRVWITAILSSTATAYTYRVRFNDSTGLQSYTGDATSVYAYAGGFQAESGAFPTGFWNGDMPLGTPVYRNTAAELIRHIVMTYGTTGQQFTLAELDIPSFVQFEAMNRQAVGLWLPSRANVLDVVNQIASSVGARLVEASNGLLTLVKLANPATGTGTAITSADMVDKSLSVSQLAPVVAGIKLGYCKNWTVQDTLAGGVDSSSVALFQQEWLTASVSDSAASANYNLFTDPDQTDSLLVVGADATIEATRRLNLFNVQRTVFKYTGFYHLIYENLGGAQTITHSRFGLSAGKTGQIITITVDFTSPHVEFEVLI